MDRGHAQVLRVSEEVKPLVSAPFATISDPL
jgi:hypothetical protein